MHKLRKIVISLGGSLIVPDEIDSEFLKKFKEIIISHDEKFVIICGGGSIARKYQKALTEINGDNPESQDWIGISATHLNAFLMKYVFNGYVEPDIIIDPTKEIQFNKKVIIVGGWKPGWSTDYDAVLLAKNIGAETVINMSNIDYVYEEDPKKNPDSKPLKEISWQDFRKLVGDTWSPGLNMPFDPIAAKEAEKNRLNVIIIGKNLDNLKKVLNQEKFEGTLIK